MLVLRRFNEAMKEEDSFANNFKNYIVTMGTTMKNRLMVALTDIKLNITSSTIEEILSAPHNF